ncbi:hypothetical protein B7463_g6672, partial [Scytalidium lignicola]
MASTKECAQRGGQRGTSAKKRAKKLLREQGISPVNNQATATPPTAASSDPTLSNQNAAVDSFQPATELDDTYDVIPKHIISSNKIQKKVNACLEDLSTFPIVPPAKPQVVMLYAKAADAAKLISIAEIVKRCIADNGGKWFQYNKVVGKRVAGGSREKFKGVKVKNSDSMDVDVEGTGVDEGMEEEGEEQEEGEESNTFETMQTPFERALENKEKYRIIPVMTIYLSRVRIDKLRKAYGQQQDDSQKCRPKPVIKPSLSPQSDGFRSPMVREERIDHGDHGNEGEEEGGDEGWTVTEVQHANGEGAEDDGEVEP